MRRHLTVAIFGLVLAAATGFLAAAEADEKAPVDTGKVWTNEDLKALDKGVSFLGGGRYISSAPEAEGPHPESWWRRQGEFHGKRVADLDAKLARLEMQRARAANPYTRTLAGRVTDADGNERLLTATEIQAQIDRLRKARDAEAEGMRALRRSANDQGVPEYWLEPPPQDAGTGPAKPKEKQLFIRPGSSSRER